MGILNAMHQSLRLSTKTPSKNNSGTMEANVANILNGNSLLMNSAAAKGERMAAQRGLQNSSIGIEAAQRAMIDAALPIAQVDSAHRQNKEMANLQADLSWRNQHNQNKFAAAQAGLDRAHQTNLSKLQADLSLRNQGEQNKFVASQAGLDRTHQANLSKLQADLNLRNQGEQNKFAASQAGLDRVHQTGLTQLQSDLAWRNQHNQNQFAASQAGLDRTHQANLSKLQAELSFNNQRKLNEMQNQFVASQSNLDRGHQRDIAQLQGDIAFNNQSRLNEMQNQFAASQSALDRSHQSNLAQIQSSMAHQNAMRQLEAQVRANTVGKSIDFAQQITNNFDAQIAAVLNNTGMDETAKSNAINHLKSNRDAEIKFMTDFMNNIPTSRQNWSAFPGLGMPNVTINGGVSPGTFPSVGVVPSGEIRITA